MLMRCDDYFVGWFRFLTVRSASVVHGPKYRDKGVCLCSSQIMRFQLQWQLLLAGKRQPIVILHSCFRTVLKMCLVTSNLNFTFYIPYIIYIYDLYVMHISYIKCSWLYFSVLSVEWIWTSRTRKHNWPIAYSTMTQNILSIINDH